MTKRVQIIRHIKSAADTFLGKIGELTVNTTDKALRVHDGTTIGGIEQARQDLVNVLAATVADDGKMSAAQASNLATTKTAVDAHIGAASGHPVATPSADGFESAADKTKLDGIEPSATVDQTAAEILAALLTVDGTGSGLDADKLDGLEGVFYAIVGVLEAATGEKLLFPQASAPTGWTKDVDQNDKALRIVNGAGGGIGGATAFSSVFGAGKLAASHVLTIAEMPAHIHAQKVNTLIRGGGTEETATGAPVDNLGGDTQSTGGDGGHTHNLSLDLQFVDIIKATKD